MHVGHCRGAIFGDVLSNLLIFNGNKVVKEYYIHDYGNQSIEPIIFVHTSLMFVFFSRRSETKFEPWRRALMHCNLLDILQLTGLLLRQRRETLLQCEQLSVAERFEELRAFASVFKRVW